MSRDSSALREFLEANMFDGDASCILTIDGNRLLDEICDNVVDWFIQAAGFVEDKREA